MPGPDPNHWLHRLTAAEWLSAADAELAQARAALTRRAVRPGVTYARRAAGMAWNALMTGAPRTFNDRYGRSYMEHIQALAEETDVPGEVRQAAILLRDTAPRPPELVTLRPDMGPVDAASKVVAYARAQISQKG